MSKLIIKEPNNNLNNIKEISKITKDFLNQKTFKVTYYSNAKGYKRATCREVTLRTILKDKEKLNEFLIKSKECIDEHSLWDVFNSLDINLLNEPEARTIVFNTNKLYVSFW